MKGRLIDLAYGLNRKQRITIEIDQDFREDFSQLRETDVEISIKKFRPRRSLDANAYMWVLIGKLSEKLGIPPTEIYQQIIPNVGGNSETVCIPTKGVERLRKSWEHNGKGWVSETMPSKLEGCTNVILYFGSSTYDSVQMSRLIDLVVQECKQLGIETATPQELERYKEEGR